MSLVDSYQLDLFSWVVSTTGAIGKESGQAAVPGISLYATLRLQGGHDRGAYSPSIPQKCTYGTMPSNRLLK